MGGSRNREGHVEIMRARQGRSSRKADREELLGQQGALFALPHTVRRR